MAFPSIQTLATARPPSVQISRKRLVAGCSPMSHPACPMIVRLNPRSRSCALAMWHGDAGRGVNLRLVSDQPVLAAACGTGVASQADQPRRMPVRAAHPRRPRSRPHRRLQGHPPACAGGEGPARHQRRGLRLSDRGDQSRGLARPSCARSRSSSGIARPERAGCRPESPRSHLAHPAVASSPESPSAVRTPAARECRVTARARGVALPAS